MRVLHLAYLSSALNNLGVLEQMELESNSKEVYGFNLDVKLWSSDSVDGYAVVKTFPWYCRWRLLQRLFFIKIINQSVKKYDHVIVRYAPCDPFILLWNFSFNNISFIHHSKESKVIRSNMHGYIGKFLAYFDDFIYWLVSSKSGILFSVTNDIFDFQKIRSRKGVFKSVIYPNGIDVGTRSLLDDRRGKFKILFVASTFFDWHGLSEILSAVKGSSEIVLHLVGNILPPDKLFIESNLMDNVILHGKLNRNEIFELSKSMDVGLASFKLESVGLNEACTLKVREYLNLGLPVYSGHKDSAFPIDFKYYRCVDVFNVSDLISFASAIRKISKEDVRAEASQYIEKKILVKKMLYKLESLKKCVR